MSITEGFFMWTGIIFWAIIGLCIVVEIVACGQADIRSRRDRKAEKECLYEGLGASVEAEEKDH